MPTRDGYLEGTPSWVDLASPDVDGAKRFYGPLFGWEFFDGGGGSMPYTMATRKGLAAAGIGALPDDGTPPVWTTYFAVDNANSTARKIEKAGGTLIIDSFEVMNYGRMALGADPAGAMFGVWEAKDHFGAAIVNEHGALNWNELTSDDLEVALPFYAQILGHSHETSERPSGPYTSISVGDRVVAGAMPKPNPAFPTMWSVFFAVDDTVAAIETSKANGGQVTYGPLHIPDVGIFAGMVDPHGARFSVIQLASPVD
jgi:predicted enzyme related to lactoylglutathione lyase